MVIAIVLIRVQAGSAEDVCKAVQEIEHVEHAHIVTGAYDIIAYAELPARTRYRRFINQLHDIPGISSTETCIAL